MADKLRIMMFGDGAWASKSLTYLYEVGHQVVGVVLRTSPSDTALEECARALKVPLYQPQNVNAQEFVAEVAARSPDLNLSVAYNQILRPPILSVAPLGFVNFHAGKLPLYRGRNIVNWAIINGEQEIGMTAHFVDEGIDSGDIILQKALPINWTDTYGDVLDRVVNKFPEFVCEAVTLIARGEVERMPQSHLVGTYFGGREEGDEWLDWTDTSFNLYNKIRAITRPGPGARSTLGEKTVVIWRASYDPSWPKYIATPGQIVGRGKEGVVVKTGDSTLLLREVQVEGGECEKPSWRIGTRLGINLHTMVQSLKRRIEELEAQLSPRSGSHD